MTSELQYDIPAAADFLRMLDPGADWFTFQTFDDSDADRKNLTGVIHGSLTQCAEKLVSLNRRGAGIFVSVNATDGKGRGKAHIKEARSLYSDLDGAPLDPVLATHPHIVNETSPGKFHSFWLIEPTDPDQAERVQSTFPALFGSDPKSVEYSKVLRLPGFYHRKGEPHLVRTIHALPDEPRWTLKEAIGWLGVPSSAMDGKPPPKGLESPASGIPEFDRRNILDGVPEGGRDDAIHKYACSMRARNFDPAEARKLILEAARNCTPPFPDGQALKCLNSAWKHPAGFAGKDQNTDAANDKHMRKFAFVHVRDLVHHVHAPAWLIPGYIESDTLTTLTAAPKTFKSFMALDWSCCIATGKAWNGRPVKQGPVFLIVGEGFGGIGRRLAAWSKHFGQSLDDAPLFVSTRAAALTDTEAANDVMTAINALHDAHGTPALIVVDTLARNFGGEDENSTPAMNRFVQAVDTLRGNAAALIVHHMGHNATRSRGSSALLGAIDFGHQMVKLNDGTVRLLTTEAKDHEESAPIEFGIEVIELDQVDHDGNPLSSVVLIPQASTGKPSAPPITTALRAALEALAQAAHEQGSSKGANVEKWRNAFYSTSTADDADTKRRAFNRARKTLVEKGLATVADDFYSSQHEAFTSRLNVLSLMEAA